MYFHVLQEIERLRHLFIVIHRDDYSLYLIVVEDDDSPPMLGLQRGQHVPNDRATRYALRFLL